MNMAAVAATECFHCGLHVAPDANWRVTIDGAGRAMCCPGCAAVAQTIVDIGQASYYRERTGFAATAGQADVPPELKLFNDDPRIVADGDACEATLLVEGIRCAACVWLIEHRLRQLDGVQQASLNVATERLFVRWHRDKTTAADILQAVRSIGYTAWPYDAARHGEQLQKASRTLGRQLFVAGLSMMQVMMYVAPEYMAAGDGTLDSEMASLLRWASLFLTLPAVAYSALPFLRGALSSLRARVLGMDVPVALGILAAFIGSAVSTFRGAGEVYYDSVTMFIFLLLCSRYLELLARRKAASALERMQHGLPESASRLRGWPESRDCDVVPASTLEAGDMVLVKAGEAIPADCVIEEGATSVDLSLLTGESAPQPRRTGNEVPGGAVNAGNAVVLRVARPARESTLSDLLKLVEQAGGAKPQIAQWADRAASLFVAGLLLFAAASFAFWWWHDAARAWPVAIAVLVVSCPCALSLATPSALAAATDRLLGKGVLIVRPHVLETLHRATHIVFDKTGTLTEGRPVVQRIAPLGGASAAECLHISAALEAFSAHPLARAISAAANANGHAPAVASEPFELPGHGVEAYIGGQRYRIGTAVFVAGVAGTPVPTGADASGAGTTVWLGAEGRWLARFTIGDALRPEARAVVQAFRKQGKEVILLSGDQQEIADAVAHELGMERGHGGCLPDQKLNFVQELQAKGAVVAMVGDGINDAAVLSAADVSFAMGSGAALAQAHADCVLLHAQLGLLAEASHTAASTMRVIRQNLAWATLYNLTAIPAAAIGLLNPWLSGIGMAASSAIVILNALRLRRTSSWKPSTF
ncbi:heavy metal translocating P-type ATPase [Pseudoduganella sp. UC29_106]|uniref:heavy metal translocating P-type ATPase n=1 Tax=Pseudoduganella sp. UC29_106 TaxID=3374553 RepID=UPI0037565A56